MKEYSQFVGIGAGILTSLSLVPQLLKVVQEKKAQDISWLMLFILLAGLGGWVWYGILKSDWPIIATNGFSFIMNVCLLIASARYKK